MEEYSGLSLHDELVARFAEAEKKRLEEEFLSRGWMPPASRSARELTPWERVGQGLKHDFEDMLYGAKKGLSGATFGASDWALGKLGITDDDYLAEREAEGLGGAVKGAGMAAELGGNMLGAGGALVKGLGKAGLKGLKLATTAGGVEGAVYGLTGSDTLSEVPQNMAVGAVTGAAVPVGLHGGAKGVKAIMHPFSSRLMTEGIKRGQSGYRDYVAKHGADEVLDFIPTKEQLKAIVPESTFNPNKYTMGEAETILRDRVKQRGLSIYNDELSHLSNAMEDRLGINHFLGTDRRPFIRTLNSTVNNPDIKLFDGKRYLIAKTYKNRDSGKDFIDWIITENGDIVTKYLTNIRKVAKEIKNNAQNVSLSARVEGVMPDGHIIKSSQPTHVNTIPLRPIVVNSELPNVNSLYEGLTDFQSKELKKALATGLSKTNAKAGSLESMYNVVQGVNDKITQAQTMNNLSRLSQLQELKGRLDAVMPEGFRNAERRSMRFGDFAIPYWSDFVTRNPNLAAGLSATAVNNAFNG